MRGLGARELGLAVLAALAGCADLPTRLPVEIGQTPWAAASLLATGGVDGRTSSPAWFHQTLPGKTPVEYRYEYLEGRVAVAARSEAGASLVRQRLRLEPAALGRLRFSWRVPQLIRDADLGTTETADSVVRIVLAFDGDRSRLSARDHLTSELIRSLTGEPMPYATLMYVWCAQRPAGSVITHPRSPRIRSLVVQSGPSGLDRWLDYERDIETDFRQAFGERPGALIGVAVMTDSDNTRSQARAWYGPVQLLPRAAR